jgi:hypothetical protein
VFIGLSTDAATASAGTLIAYFAAEKRVGGLRPANAGIARLRGEPRPKTE